MSLSKLIKKSVSVPGSKSYTNRALIMVALAKGKSMITGISESIDSRIMIDCLKQLGIKITQKNNQLEVIGNNGQFEKKNLTLNIGQAGLSLVQSQKPDIILLDIILPGGMNGFDILEQLRRNPSTKQIPVVILTNLDSEEKVAKTIGATDYLVKVNTTKDEIVKLVMDCLSRPKPEVH